MDPLSLAASTFAVVGVIDVTSRAGVGAYRFLSDIKNAPVEIENLKGRVMENIHLVEQSKHLLQEMSRQTLSVTTQIPPINLHETLDLLKAVIRSLGRELNFLAKLANKHVGASKAWGSIRWVLDDQKVTKSLQRLEASKTSLNTALSLLGRQQAIWSQCSIEHTIQDGLQELVTRLDTYQAHVESAKDQQLGAIRKSRTATTSLQRDMSVNRRITRKEHTSTRRCITEGNSKVIKAICTKFDEVSRVRILDPNKIVGDDREFEFIGKDKEEILLPLLLIKEHFRQSILAAISQHDGHGSLRNFYWLQVEFDSLVSSVTQEIAAIPMRSSTSHTNGWVNPSQPFNWSKPWAGNRRNSQIYVSGTSNRTKPATGKTIIPNFSERDRVHPAYREYKFESMIGRLRIRLPIIYETAQDNLMTDEVEMTFTPFFDLCRTPFAARFKRFTAVEENPKFYAQLNAYKLVESDELHVNLYKKGSLVEIDTAYRNGLISPYDVDCAGNVLCHDYSVRFGRPEILWYLDAQGLGPSALNNENCVLYSFWLSVNVMEKFDADVSTYFGILQFLEQKLGAITFAEADSLLVQTRDTSEKDSAYSCEKISFIRKWMRLLQKSCYDFELAYNDGGLTPLLQQLCFSGKDSLQKARLLIDFGANIHATTGTNALNALQCAMYASSLENLDTTEEKLNMLIGLGVDIHCQDSSGLTPSDVAFYLNGGVAWDAWCRVLQRNGGEISQVLRAEGKAIFLNEITLEKVLLKDSGSDRKDEVKEEEGKEGNATDSKGDDTSRLPFSSD